MTASCQQWADAALNLIYPPLCQVCLEERAGARDGYVCGKCWSNVEFIMAPFCDRCGLPFEGQITPSFVCTNCYDLQFFFRSARSAVRAKAMMLQIIHRYKYNHALYFEPFLADLFVRQAGTALREEKWDLIIPVPLHPAKERERQFNQAERLSRHLSGALDIPVKTNIVRRIKATATQTFLGKTERGHNMAGAFAPSAGQKLTGEKVILVDDVLTTGATTSACAQALLQAGASEVCVWTLARGT